jgi:serine/threonine protein kinase
MPAGWRARGVILGGAAFMASETRTEACLRLEDALAVEHPRMMRSLGRSASTFARKRGTPPASVPSQKAELAVPPLSPTKYEELVRHAGFTLLKEVGQDDHGLVYQANDRRGRMVLIRFLKHPFEVDTRAAFARLEKELKGLKHSAVVRVLQLIGDAGSKSVIAVVSEHFAGPTLTEWISQSGLPDPLAATHLVLTLAEALECAQRRLIVHGNMTPENILMDMAGKPHIVGFGLSRFGWRPDVSRPNVQAFVAPELLQSPTIEPTLQSDVFSLGVLLYRLLTGVLPENDASGRYPRTPREVDPELPADLETICLKAMNTDPAARYGTAGEFAAALRRAPAIKRRGLLGRIAGPSKPKRGSTTLEQEKRGDFWK